MKNKISFIAIYSLSHFIVDFVCSIFILGNLPYIANSNNELIVAIIIYNFFAFAFQVPLGYILDKFTIYNYISILGISLIGLCYLINYNNVFILATIVGIGNALFHLEGGINTYSLSNGKAFLNGLFVAPGALGIFLGTVFHDTLVLTYLPIFLIFVSIFLLFFTQRKEVAEKIQKSQKYLFNKTSMVLIVILIGLSIIVRSIGGSAIIYTWKNSFILGLIYTVSIIVGKVLGGLLADNFGLLKVALISLAFSAICLILGYNIHLLAYVGILLFNIPMSITLTILENTLSKKIACAVGLNTLFLFIGFLICLINITINNNLILIVSIMIAMLSIYFSCKLYLKGGIKNEKI